MRTLFPSFDEEAEKIGVGLVVLASCLSLWPMILSLRLGNADWFIWYGNTAIQRPSDYFPPGQAPQTVHCSRVAFETLLCKLVLKHMPEIRVIGGMVTGLVKSSERTDSVGGVNIRLPSGQDVTEPASLVIGKSLSRQTIKHL